MCRLLLNPFCKHHVLFSVQVLLFFNFILWGVLGTETDRQRRGPNECSDDPDNPCCPGWKVAPTSGQCLLAVCDDGCGLGTCIGANLCRCSDGSLANYCEGDVNPASRDSYHPGSRDGYQHAYPASRDSYEESSRDSYQHANPAIRDSYEESSRDSYQPPNLAIRDSYEESIRDSYEESSRDSYEESSRDSYQPASRDSYQPASRDSYQPVSKDSYEESSRDSYEESSRDSYEESSRDSYQPASRDSYQPASRDSYQPASRDSYQPASRDSYQPVSQDSFPSAYKYDKSLGRESEFERGPSRGQSPDDSPTCEQLGCQQRCDIKNGIPRCDCFAGYRLDPNGLTCNDVDECVQYAHICSQMCRNVAGGFVCECQPGYVLHTDGKTCKPAEKTTTEIPLAEAPADVNEDWRRYIDDMLDPRKPPPTKPPPVEPTQPSTQQPAQSRQTSPQIESNERFPQPKPAAPVARTQPRTQSPSEIPNQRHNRLRTSAPAEPVQRSGQTRRQEAVDPALRSTLPRNPSTVQPTQRHVQPRLNIKARIRTTQQRATHRPYLPEHEQPEVPHEQQPSFDGHPYPHMGVPHNTDPRYRGETEGVDPYNLPSQFNPSSRYEQLPPELTKQMFGNYDRKKLVPFDFEDRKYEKPFREGGPNFEDPGSRAIFWEEVPTDIARTFGTELPEFTDPSFQAPGFREVPEPVTTTNHRQADSERASLSQPHIRMSKTETRKSSNRRHRKRGRNHRRKGRRHRARSKKGKTDNSKTTILPPPEKSISRSNSTKDKERLQKDGKACRGDLCYFPEDVDEPAVTPIGVFQTDDFGRCPKGFELVIVNDFEVCKPLPESQTTMSPPTSTTSLSTAPEHSLNNIGHGKSDGTQRRNTSGEKETDNVVEVFDSMQSTLPPFINFCVKEGKIMIITETGIHCKNKAEENIFLNCEQYEVYVETVAGYICRDPSTEDILATPIQCPFGHTLIKTNTGYECRGTVTLESACPDGYDTMQTMSGTICSPSAPLASPMVPQCSEGNDLMETAEGMKCLPVTDELYAATPVLTNKLATPLVGAPTDDPVGMPPKPDIQVPTSSPLPEATTAEIICPHGQIGVQSETGPVCKYYTWREQGRGDQPPSCPEGTTQMNTKSGPICIGASVVVEYEGPVTLVHESEGLVPTISSCPEGQIMVNTVDGEMCQDIQRPFVLPTGDILLIQNVCPDGQIAVNTSQGSECRWIGLEKDLDSGPLCPDGCSVQQTNFGLLCINDTTGEPALDYSSPCPDGKIALFTPKGSICKSEGVIVGKILTFTEVDQLSTQPGCGLNNIVFQTLAGPLCLDKVSREPIFDSEKLCPDSELGVLTPSGVTCKLRSDILMYTLSGESCTIGQTVASTQAGPICVYVKTKEPVIDSSVSCPDGQAPVVTPSGTFCKLRSALVISLFEETDVGCQAGQTVLETAAGQICIHIDTLLPVTDESVNCADGQDAIVTPKGTFCKYRSAILTRLSETEDEGCADGQGAVDTEGGTICIDSKTLQPIIDESVSCPDEQTPVVTPSGTLCKLRSAILTRLIKKPKGKIEVATAAPTRSCGEGQKVLETEVGVICIYSKTLVPVVDESISCPSGQAAVVTPTGTLCTLRSAILTRLTEKAIVTPEPETASCSDGQIILDTKAGAVCIHNETLQPVIDESGTCPDGQASFVTPTGIFCKLRSAVWTYVSGKDEGNCTDGHQVLETDAGAICIHKLTLQPIINETVSCPDGHAPVVTPKGTFCKYRSAILTRLTTTEIPGCRAGQKIFETEIGAICIDCITMYPIIDESMSCPEGYTPTVTPTGNSCMFSSVIARFFGQPNVTESEDQCSVGQLVFETDGGLICIYEKTEQPVIDKSKFCPDGLVAVVSPSGIFCMLRSVIFAKLKPITAISRGVSPTTSLPEFCNEGQTILQTEAGPICIYEENQQPVIDESMTCPDDQVPVVAPSGTFCLLRTRLLAKLSKISVGNNSTSSIEIYPGLCVSGQTILNTDIGQICIEEGTSDPVINITVLCPEGEMPVVTSTGTFCKLQSAIIARTVLISSAANRRCSMGHRVEETKFYGPVCVFEDTAIPVVDNSTTCKENHVAIVTPNGPICFPDWSFKQYLLINESDTESATTIRCSNGQSLKETYYGPMCMFENTGILVTDSSTTCKEGNLAIVTPNGPSCFPDLFFKQYILLNETGTQSACGEGQKVHQIKSFQFCVYEDTLEPVIDLKASCSKAKISVLTPTGFVCKSRRAVFGKKKKFEAAKPKGAPAPQVELRCGAGQKVNETQDGFICVDEETLDPIFDESVTCPDSKVPYVTPLGTVCKLRPFDTGYEKTREDRYEEDLSGCGADQQTHMIDAGVICVYLDTLEPVIDESVFCPEGKVAVRTPSGTSCRLEERIFMTTTAEATTVVSSTTTSTETPTITPAEAASTVPSCPSGQELVLREGRFICEESPTTGAYVTSSLTTPITTPVVEMCGEGQIMGESALGMICVYSHSLEAVIDEEVICPNGEVAIVTPKGTVCMLRSVVLEEVEPSTTVTTPFQPTRIPVCPHGQRPVLKDGKFVCRHVIVSKSDVEPSTQDPRPDQTRDMCFEGQRIYLTPVGKICVYERTLDPVVNESVSCPSWQVAFMTPSGLACLNKEPVFSSLPGHTDSPAVTQTHSAVDHECPEGQVRVTENGRLVCKPEDKGDAEECPPGYQKVTTDGSSHYQCTYVGFGTTKAESDGEADPRHPCPVGMVFIQTPDGPACRYPTRTTMTTSRPQAGPERIPHTNFRPAVVTGQGQPCTPGVNCGGIGPRPSGESIPCPVGMNCGGIQPGLNGQGAPCIQGINCGGPVARRPAIGPRPSGESIPCPVGMNCGGIQPGPNGQAAPCLQGINCGVPVARTPVGCFNGIQIATGQPCMPQGMFPQIGPVPCSSGSNCGPPCQTASCGGGSPVVPPSYNGCVNGVASQGGSSCGVQPRPSYPFTVSQSCSNGFQPYQRGKVYMCVPVKFRGLCQNNMMLAALLGRGGCNGVHQAVPPQRLITPCTLNGRYPVTGTLSSACSPLSGLQPVEGAEGVCRNGERLFQSANGRTVCLPVTAVTSTPMPQVQQEALPTCGASERLVQTDRGYVCQPVSGTDCNPPCANGGTCRNGVCRCPRGLAGTTCQTDVDECKSLPERYCHYKCMNGFGSFRCVCPTGYTLNADRRTCKVQGCTPDCMNGGTCVRGQCRCSSGFTGRQCQSDVDECSTRDGLCEYQCRNTVGSYTCLCPAGSRLNEDRRSCDSQVCMPSCQNGATCKDHRCFCAPGYFGVSCQLDINECFHFRPCSHLCHNTKGSYICACRPGYRLASDGRMCLRDSPPEGRSRQRRRHERLRGRQI